jgi:hypothetical protein
VNEEILKEEGKLFRIKESLKNGWI